MKDEKKVEQSNEETVELFGGKENLDKIAPWDFISAIKDAQDQAMKEGIRANTILINSRLVKTKPFMIMLTPFLGAEVPPMICGLETKLADDLPQEFAFAIMQAPQTERERLTEKAESERKKIKKREKLLRRALWNAILDKVMTDRVYTCAQVCEYARNKTYGRVSMCHKCDDREIAKKLYDITIREIEEEENNDKK